MKLKVLINLYRTYFPRLVEAQTLLVALERLPQDMVLPAEIRASMPNLPPVREEKSIATRVGEVRQEIQILEERVKSIKEAIIEIVGEEKWEEMEKGFELLKQ